MWSRASWWLDRGRSHGAGVIQRGFGDVGGVRSPVSEGRTRRSPQAAKARHVKCVSFADRHVLETVEQGVSVVGSWTEPRSFGDTTVFVLLMALEPWSQKGESKEVLTARARGMECVSFAEQDMFWKQYSSAPELLARGRSHGTGVIQRYPCCWRR
jgi:hypothetical protein